jgi:adenylyl- and sulfurtransferase ThiI
MNNHFTNFTKEAMRALGQELADASQQRAKFVGEIRRDISNLLAGFHEETRQSETQRRHRAANEAADRQSFISQLRAGIRTLRDGFQTSREEKAADFREMAEEARSARDAFRNRPGQRADFHVKTKPASRGTAKAQANNPTGRSGAKAKPKSAGKRGRR